MTKKMFFLGICIVPMMTLAQNYKSSAWCPDNGDGTYTNPVINADYSDPDVIAVGEDYYLTASSFANMPGLPILHSKDMVNWRIINYALQSQFPDKEVPEHGNGVWAPSIRYHNGEFYIYWGDPDNGVMMVKTKDPYAKWDAPVCIIPGKGMIDTTPLWDDDGRCYLVNGWAGSRSGFNSVLTVREMSADGTKAIGNPVIVFDGNNTNHTAEGPKFYKRDGWYWIMCPAGGVETGWQLAMRSKSPYGPYECKTVLAQGNTTINGPHQGAWVHTAFGEDWFMHFQDKGCYGRVVHLQPVTWKDNWPVMGNVPKKGYCGEPVLTHAKPKTAAPVPICNPVESDEFNTTQLGLQWQWAGDYNQVYGMPTADGFFRLYCYKLGTKDVPVNLWKSPALLLQKTPADEFTASAKVRFAAKAEQQYGGIIMMGMDYSALVVKRVGDGFELQQLTCKGADKGKAETATTLATFKPTEVDKINYAPAIYEEIYLRMKVKDGKCRFAYSTNGKSYKEVGEEFTMREGKWVGAKFGLVASQPTDIKGNKGFLDIDWFRVTK
ncbi:MAG: glycoside hydrolase 43 family protein [Prevotella sp.]|nr:glycoside hydrolase 43 family protein [Prevotella sp.]